MTDSATVTSVQFLVDGAPFGAPVTTGGPTYSLAVSSLPPGQHIISAQAVDSNYLIGTAPAVTVTTPATVGNIQVDQQVHRHRQRQRHDRAPSRPRRQASSSWPWSALTPPPTGQTATVSGAGLTWIAGQAGEHPAG